MIKVYRIGGVKFWLDKFREQIIEWRKNDSVHFIKLNCISKSMVAYSESRLSNNYTLTAVDVDNVEDDFLKMTVDDLALIKSKKRPIYDSCQNSSIYSFDRLT